MRSLALIASMSILCASTLAGEIREFDLKTIERLGNELTRVIQSSEKGATTPARRRAKQTAMAALQGKLFNVRYDYVVVDDPDGSGFLVYALGKGSKPGDVVVCGHFRVTVSADGEKAARVDANSEGLRIENKNVNHSPPGYHDVGIVIAQRISKKPVETFIYANLLLQKDLFITGPDFIMWSIQNGKVGKSNMKK